MKLRAEIEPKMAIAEKHYQTILDIICEYENYVDENGDEDNEQYKKIETRIGKLTGKDMSRYNLYETWESEGSEVLSFRIGLPDPEKVDNITDDEIREVVTRIRTFDYPEKVESFEDAFGMYLDHYYHSFLKLNCRKYNYAYFICQKDGSEFSIEQIVEKLVR